MGLIQLMNLLKDTGSGRNDLLRQDPFDLSRICPPRGKFLSYLCNAF